MPKAIKVIPATKDRFTALPTVSIAKRRVAAYARVSTDSDEQFTSYEAQIDYYTQYIKKREDWEFIKVYTDEGISGTNTKRREGFNDMVADALAGKIDLIVTKSVSRFARNTVDSLVTVRKLKEHHVEVFFEKENIYTFDSNIVCCKRWWDELTHGSSMIDDVLFDMLDDYNFEMLYDYSFERIFRNHFHSLKKDCADRPFEITYFSISGQHNL